LLVHVNEFLQKGLEDVVSADLLVFAVLATFEHSSDEQVSYSLERTLILLLLFVVTLLIDPLLEQNLHLGLKLVLSAPDGLGAVLVFLVAALAIMDSRLVATFAALTVPLVSVSAASALAV